MILCRALSYEENTLDKSRLSSTFSTKKIPAKAPVSQGRSIFTFFPAGVHDRPERIAEHASGRVRDDVRNVRTAECVQQRLHDLDADTERQRQQQAAPEAAPPAAAAAAQRQQNAERDKQGDVQHDLPDIIAVAEDNVLKRRHVHGDIRMVKAERQRREHRHERKAHDPGEAAVHERIDEQRSFPQRPPLRQQPDAVNGREHGQIDENLCVSAHAQPPSSLPVRTRVLSAHPLLQFRFCALDRAAAQRQAARDPRALRRPLDVLLRVRQAAALVRAERMDGFPLPVIVLKKGVDRHRHGTAVVRIAEVDFFIVVQTLRQRRQFRTGVRAQIAPRLGDAGVIVVRIRHLLLDVEQFRTGEFGKQSCRLLRVADGDGAARPGKIVLSRAGVIGNEFFHDPFA